MPCHVTLKQGSKSPRSGFSGRSNSSSYLERLLGSWETPTDFCLITGSRRLMKQSASLYSGWRSPPNNGFAVKKKKKSNAGQQCETGDQGDLAKDSRVSDISPGTKRLGRNGSMPGRGAWTTAGNLSKGRKINQVLNAICSPWPQKSSWQSCSDAWMWAGYQGRDTLSTGGQRARSLWASLSAGVRG